MRILLRGILAILALLILAGAYLVWNNNRSAQPADHAQLENAFQNSIRWLTEHRQTILDTDNPMLWRMVQQAGAVSGDSHLQALFADYAQAHLKHNPNNIWHPLFYPKSWVPVRFDEIASFPYYNWHFIYAYTCDKDLAREPQITAQNDPTFCDDHRLSPACVTHQMMGLLLLKRSQCGDQSQLEDSIAALQGRIHAQLTWDPRVVDVYMQRVLMLVESGAADAVKPVWLNHLIDAQQEDGGWSPFMPVIPIGGGYALGTKRLLSIESPQSKFHMTA